MLIKSLKFLFERDLGKLKQEIESYSSEEKLWMIDKNISNSGGNLCLHVLGNLNTYIGAGLGNTNYIRQREFEFSQKNIARSILLESIEETNKMVQSILDSITEEKLQEIYPKEVREDGGIIFHFLIHLESHLNYHLGQINYHRRLMDN